MLATDPGAAILRISLPMGPSFNHHAGAIDWIQSRFRAGRKLVLVSARELTGGASAARERDCARALARTPAAGCRGTV